MAKIHLKSTEISVYGSLPEIGAVAPDFVLTKSDFSYARLSDFEDQHLILNIFPSVDTGTCATSVRRFNQEAAALKNTAVLCISKDLPFAQARFCGAEGIDKVIMLSDFRDQEFSKKYGLKMTDGPLAGLLARGVVVLDQGRKVLYTEIVRELSQEPNYEAALKSLPV